MEDISKLKESVNDFLSYSTEYIQDLQDKIAKLNEENNTLRQQNRFLRMALKYINKKNK
jgi:regulator of replication initiation timing